LAWAQAKGGVFPIKKLVVLALVAETASIGVSVLQKQFTTANGKEKSVTMLRAVGVRGYYRNYL